MTKKEKTFEPINAKIGDLTKAVTAPFTKENVLQKATHTGKLHIGNKVIRCAVLNNGKRVVIQREVVYLLTGNKKGGLDRYFKAANLLPYVPNKFRDKALDQAIIKFDFDGCIAQGFEGEDLVDICYMYIEAKRAGVLLPSQEHLAVQAEIIVKSFAKLGIIGLIDEVTGYQDIRKRDALQKILDAFLNKELAAWIKRFPDEFYNEMFRLKGWQWNSKLRPGVVGKYTNDIVYERLAPALVEELKKKNPKNKSGNRVNRHHQWLTDDIGHPALAQHLHAVIGLMRASTNWGNFMRLINKSFPKKGTQMELFDD